MSVATSSSRAAPLQGGTWASSPRELPRAEGHVEVRFERRGERTVLADLYQSGSAKARFPRAFDGGPPEAVLINTAGGITGADCFRQRIRFGEATHAIVTTQAAEKIYRAGDGDAPADVDNGLTLEAGAVGEWLPQETIFFDGARLRRRFDVRLDPASRLLACEALVFGRAAMGETVRRGWLRDDWRVHVGGRLVYADGMRFAGAVQDHLDRPAVAAGGRALATVLYVGADGESLAVEARRTLAPFASPGRRAAVSWIGDVMVARFVAADGADLRDMLTACLSTIRRGAGVPKLWRC